MASKDRQLLKAVWFDRALPMLPGGGAAHIGASPAWKGWVIEIDRVTAEVCIAPPKDNAMGRLRVPMSNVLAFQLSSATKTE